MFGLFKKSPAGPKVIDKVWMSTSAKWKACGDMIALNPTCLILAWFDDTTRQLRDTLKLSPIDKCIANANDITLVEIEGRMVMFAEHYPLASIEQEIFRKLNLKEVPVLSSLDEPFFGKFGGERTIELMKKIGMKDDEVLGHPMITKSIHRAQEKIASNVKAEIKCTSQQQWLEINLR